MYLAGIFTGLAVDSNMKSASFKEEDVRCCDIYIFVDL
jgi:hypothetical protein